MSKKISSPEMLTGLERTVYDALSTGKASSADLAAFTGIAAQRIAATCYSLRNKGLIKSDKIPGHTTDAKSAMIYMHSCLPWEAPPQVPSETPSEKPIEDPSSPRKQARRSRATPQPLIQRLNSALAEVVASVERLSAVCEEAQEALNKAEQLKAMLKAI